MSLGALAMFFLSMCRPREGGNPYYRTMHHNASLFTGFSLFSISFFLISTSTIFAGIRRATGLTFRRHLSWPPFSVQTSEKLLHWYDTRLLQINEKAEQHIQRIIARYSADISDPNVRLVWEKQIREDVLEKVERIRERRKCCADLVEQAKMRRDRPEAESKRHHPVLAVYLFVGEKVLDKIIRWMRNNPHFCYESSTESGGLVGAVSIEELLNPSNNNNNNNNVIIPGSSSSCGGGGGGDGSGSMDMLLMTPSQQLLAQMQSSEIKQPGSSVGDTSQCAFYEQRQGSSPTAYIATAASMVSDQVPEPSAPTLSESEYLRITSSQPYMTEAPSSSRSPLLHQVVDPPPYTPIDGYTDSCSHDSDEFENKTAIAQALD